MNDKELQITSVMLLILSVTTLVIGIVSGRYFTS